MTEQKVRVFSKLYEKTEKGKKVCYVRFGLKNSNDKVILAPLFQIIGTFNNGLAIIMKDKKMGVINQKGEFVLPLKYDKIENQCRNSANFILTNNSVFDLPDDGKVTVFSNGKYEKFNLLETQNSREFI